jgi:hypothetical protein
MSTISLSIPLELRKKIAVAADRDCRNISEFIRKIVADDLGETDTENIRSHLPRRSVLPRRTASLPAPAPAKAKSETNDVHNEFAKRFLNGAPVKLAVEVRLDNDDQPQGQDLPQDETKESMFEEAVRLCPAIDRKNGLRHVMLCVPIKDNGRVDYDRMMSEVRFRSAKRAS